MVRICPRFANGHGNGPTNERVKAAKFNAARSDRERDHAAPDQLRSELYSDSVPARIFITHIRPELTMGKLQLLHIGSSRTAALGFLGQGGTLTVPGMLFINRCTWAHILEESARVLSLPRDGLLNKEELAALEDRVSPEGVII